MGKKRSHAPQPFGGELLRTETLCDSVAEDPNVAWANGDTIDCVNCLGKMRQRPQLFNVYAAHGFVIAARERKSKPRAANVDPRQTNFGDLFEGGES
jgi:hypothetical protein